MQEQVLSNILLGEIVFSSIYCKTSDYSNVRHSSGLPVYARYQQPAMPYSPMALNNLNNPFSPQVEINSKILRALATIYFNF